MVAGRGRQRQNPQADRGDLYSLTAATFTVLTGFTGAGPTGLGASILSARRGGGQQIIARMSAPLPGFVSEERLAEMSDARWISGVGLDGYEVESKLASDARVRVDPGL